MSRRQPVVYWSELGRLQERLARLLEQALVGAGAAGQPTDGSPTAAWKPLVDVVETAEAFVLYAELPGVQRSDLELHSDGNSVELSGIRRPFGDHGFLRLEGTYGPFRRRLDLPEPVVESAIEARFRRGILEVVLPKRRAVAQVAVRED